MLTVEIRGPAEAAAETAEVEIFCDVEGLAKLINHLEKLMSGTNHLHLMTPAWAGNELDEEKVGKGTYLINHLRVTLLSQIVK